MTEPIRVRYVVVGWRSRKALACSGLRRPSGSNRMSAGDEARKSAWASGKGEDQLTLTPSTNALPAWMATDCHQASHKPSDRCHQLWSKSRLPFRPLK